MTWLSKPRGEKLHLLGVLGLRPRDAKHTLLLAEAAEPRPVPHNPLVGGYAHPERLTAHRVDEDDTFLCGTRRSRAYFRITPKKVKENDLEPCKRCFGL